MTLELDGVWCRTLYRALAVTGHNTKKSRKNSPKLYAIESQLVHDCDRIVKNYY